MKKIFIAFILTGLFVISASCGKGDPSAYPTGTGTGVGTGSVRTYLEITWFDAATSDNLTISDSGGNIVMSNGYANANITPAQESQLASLLDAADLTNAQTFGSSGATVVFSVKSSSVGDITIRGNPTGAAAPYVAIANYLKVLWNSL